MFDLAGRSGPEQDEGHRDDVHSVHWSPNEQHLLTGSFDGTMRLWQANSGALTRTIRAHDGRIEDCYWDPQRDQLISAARDGTIRSWDPHDGKLILDISAHDGFVLRLCAARKSRILYSASSDGSVRVWDRDDLRLIHVLKGFTGTPHDLSLSHDEKLLAVKDDNTSVRVYRTDTYELVDRLIEYADHHNWYSRATFHPCLNELAATGERDRQLNFWTYDSDVLSRAASETSARTYANCRVGVLGSTGVGKTSLTNALIGEPFKPTESTHATKVVLLARTSSNESDSESWVREVFMWDFAGQPAYRLLQRFDVEGLAVALLVLDSRNTTDPTEEIAEWETLLRLASKSSAPSPPRIVVIARSDRGALSTTLPVDVWPKHIQNFVGTIETSAKENYNIDKLRTAIISSIDWNHLPTITSDAQFQRLRMYVRQQASQGEVVEKVHTLLAGFAVHCDRLVADPPTNPEFRALLAGLESEGLVKQLGFGDLVLLEPTLLRSYGSMILLAAQRADDALGVVSEDDVLTAHIPLLSDERIADSSCEKDILHAAIQEFVSAGVIIRAGSPTTIQFPSAVRRPLDERIWDHLAPGCIFSLSATIDHSWSSLAVNLKSSELFSSCSLWNYAASFEWREGCSSWLRVRRDGPAHVKVELRHDETVPDLQRALIQEFARGLLKRLAVDGTLALAIAISCPECRTLIPEEQVQRRLERGMRDIACNVCDQRIDLAVPKPSRTVGSIARIEMQTVAAIEKNASSASIDIKRKRDLYDVFISYAHEDADDAIRLAEELRERGIRPWIDVWELPPGKPWLSEIANQLHCISSAAVLLGPSGIGPWQQDEATYLLQQFFARRCPVIPVLLRGAREPELPPLLAGMHWVDFRRPYPDPVSQLIWGITGVRPETETVHQW